MAKTVYQLYLEGAFNMLQNKKVIKPNIIQYCLIYETYLHFKWAHGYSLAVVLTADQMCCSERTVKRAINVVTK